EQLAGDLPAAERALRSALEIEYAIGKERDELSQTSARLAFVLWRQGLDDEASEMAAISASAAPAESVAAQALASAAQARATGDAKRARMAVESLPDEMLNLRRDLLVDLDAPRDPSPLPVWFADVRDPRSHLPHSAVELDQLPGFEPRNLHRAFRHAHGRLDLHVEDGARADGLGGRTDLQDVRVPRR